MSARIKALLNQGFVSQLSVQSCIQTKTTASKLG